MKLNGTILDILLVIFSLVAAFFIDSLLLGIGRHWAAIIALAVLFALLFGCAMKRGWKAPFRLPVVGSDRLRELFLALALMTVSLAIAWYLGVAISRSYSEIEGVLASLCIFGVLMLAVSSAKNWQ